MKKAILGARLVFGLIFTVFGLNGFLNFMPAPPLPEPALNFIMALAGTGYLMVLVKGIEVLVGLAMLTNTLVPFALVLIAPVVVNIFLFHIVLAPAGAAIAVLVFALNAFLLYGYRGHYRRVFEIKGQPTE